jgi:hypothetical protein
VAGFSLDELPFEAEATEVARAEELEDVRELPELVTEVVEVIDTSEIAGEFCNELLSLDDATTASEETSLATLLLISEDVTCEVATELTTDDSLDGADEVEDCTATELTATVALERLLLTADVTAVGTVVVVVGLVVVAIVSAETLKAPPARATSTLEP